MTEFQIKEDGRTMIPSVFSHAGKKELVLLQYPQLQALDMVKHCFTTRTVSYTHLTLPTT